jgi:hypothetical protein
MVHASSSFCLCGGWHCDRIAAAVSYSAHLYAQYGRWTALMMAARDGHANCVRLLVDAGADKDAKDKVRVSNGLVLASLRYFCDRSISCSVLMVHNCS